MSGRARARGRRARRGQPTPVPSPGNEPDGFQILGSKLDEIFKRLDRLEQTNRGTTGAETASVSSSHRSDLTANSLTTANSQASSSSQTNATVYIGRPNIDKPKFTGRDDLNPIKFLEKLKKYIRAIGGSERALEIAEESLGPPAQNILGIYRDRWVSLEDFEADFLRVYWNERAQEKVRIRLMNSIWDRSKSLTMEEHFAEQIDSARKLTIPLSEKDLVNCVMRHFPADVQRIWFTRGNNVTIFSAAEFLREIEQNVAIRADVRVANFGNVPTTANAHRGRGTARLVNNINYQNRRDYVPRLSTISAVSNPRGGYRNRRGQGRVLHYNHIRDNQMGRGNQYHANRGRNFNYPAIKFERPRAAENKFQDNEKSIVTPSAAGGQDSEKDATSKN